MSFNDMSQFLTEPSLARDAFVGLVGICVGSFLNVLALRSLEEKNPFFPPSGCPDCNHRLGPMDLIPIVSYLMLGGRCRYCNAKISWQYPVVELVTGIAFIVVVKVFGATVEGAGLLVFVSTLIAICVTDFREKLIPHEITYPAIVLGLIYTQVCSSRAMYGEIQLIQHDLTGCMIGIAISYMLFDYIAFYGGKMYEWMHRHDDDDDDEKTDEVDALDDAQLDSTFDIRIEPEVEEEVEVMGGGDAVLGALIAAWVGLPRWSMALVLGFLIGALMGGVYLAIELKKEKMLHETYVPSGIFAVIILALIEGTLVFFAQVSQQAFTAMPWLPLGIFGLLCGALIGIVRTGSKVSKPFPFGPALALGALISMFVDPLTGPLSGSQ